jgi:hypothetical protein
MAPKVGRCLAAAALATTLAQSAAAARDLTKNERATVEEGVSWQLQSRRHGEFRWLSNAGIPGVTADGVSGDYYCGYVGAIPFQVLVVRDGAGNIKVTVVGPVGEDPASAADARRSVPVARLHDDGGALTGRPLRPRRLGSS